MAHARPLLVALLVLLAACSSEAAPESLSSSPAAAREAPSERAGQDFASASEAPLVALPTHGQPLVRPGGTGSMMQALIAGRLAGDPKLDGGCVWLESGDARISVLWPAGFGVRFLPFGPFQLVDERGDVVAYEGDQLEAAGGYGDGQTPRCQVGNGPAILQGELTVTARGDAGGADDVVAPLAYVATPDVRFGPEERVVPDVVLYGDGLVLARDLDLLPGDPEHGSQVALQLDAEALDAVLKRLEAAPLTDVPPRVEPSGYDVADAGDALLRVDLVSEPEEVRAYALFANGDADATLLGTQRQAYPDPVVAVFTVLDDLLRTANELGEPVLDDTRRAYPEILSRSQMGG